MIVRTRSNPSLDTDTDSIGQQTLDEFTDAQEEPRDDHLPREEGEDPNSNTGECRLSALFPLMLTRSLDQSNEQIPDLEQYVDGFNWDEEFSGDFDDGEFDGFADQSNVEGRLGSQEPTSGRNSKRGFDEVDSDTADEEGVLGDISPSKSLSTSMRPPILTSSPQIQNERRCCSLDLCWADTLERTCDPCTYPLLFFLTYSLRQPSKVKCLSVLAS